MFNSSIKDLWQRLQPYVKREINSALGAIAFSSSDNSGSGDIDTGANYLRDDGSVPLVGNLPVATGKMVDGVDISELDISYQSHLVGDSHMRYADAEGYSNRPAAYANRLLRHITTSAASGLQGGGQLVNDLALSIKLASGSALSLSAAGLSVAANIAGSGLEWAGGVISAKIGAGLEIVSNTIQHATGDFGDVHTNYAEHAGNETIAGNWTFSSTLNLAALQVGAWLKAVGGKLLVGVGTSLNDTLVSIGATSKQLELVNTTGNGFALVSVIDNGTTELSTSGELVLDSNNSIVPKATYKLTVGSDAKKLLKIYASELQVGTLVAASTMATIGGRILVAPTSKIVADNGATIDVEHNIFDTNDIVFLEKGGQVEFMRIDGTDSNGSETDYSYYVTRNLDGSGTNTWVPGDAIVNLGNVGDGWIDIFSRDGMSSEAGPSVVINRRFGNSYNDWAERTALGNLKGTYDYATDSYGFAAGDPSAIWMSVDEMNGFRVMGGSTQKAQWDTSGNILLGNPAASNLQITSNDLRIRQANADKITLSGDGKVYVDGTISVSSTGKIVAADDRLTIDKDGLSFATGSWSNNVIRWLDSSSAEVVKMQAFVGGPNTAMLIDSNGELDLHGYNGLRLRSHAGTLLSAINDISLSTNFGNIWLSPLAAGKQVMINKAKLLGPVDGNQQTIRNTNAIALQVRRQNSGFTVPSGTITPIAFDTIVSGNYIDWSSSLPSRFIAPEPGYYAFSGRFRYDNPSYNKSGNVIIGIRQNGGQSLAQQSNYRNTVNLVDNSVSLSAVYLNTGDYLELFAYHQFGTNITLAYGTQNFFCSAELVKVV